MMFAVRRFIFGLLVSMCFAGTASAQYMKITTDNPADNTRMRASGTTLLTITLDTNHDKNGSLQTCNSHASVNCGATGTVQALDMFSYTLALKAVGGTVTWGAFTAADAAYTDTSPQIQSATEVEINKSRPTGTFTAPGLATIGTIPVTTLTGDPGINVQIGGGTLNPFGFGTGFGTTCDGNLFPNTYVIGDPTDPCGTVNGIAGDWFDFDGAVSFTGSTPPVITAPATWSGTEGTAMADLTANATDLDGSKTLTITQSGMPAFLTFSSTPHVSPATATISGTPGFTDAGTYNISWSVSDGAGGSANTSTTLTVANTNRAPTLNQPANMTVNEGATAEQTITGSDPDGDVLTFGLVSGPPYMTLGTADGLVRLAPSFTSSGTASATVSATDPGGLTNQKSFTITVVNVNRAPVLLQPTSMTVTEGATADQGISGTDQDGDALTFTKTAGPAFVTVTTLTSTTGNIHLAPTAGTAGTYTATLVASDAVTSSTPKNVQITVNAGANNPPVLAQPANMTVNEGATANQALSATDADGQALTFAKVSGPAYATVTTTTPGTGTGTGNIHLAPGFSDAGTAAVTVSATDGTATDTKSLTVTVNNVNQPPVLNAVADMSVAQGATSNQVISGTDPDSDALTFAKISGPTFMTVTTTNATTGNIHLAAGASEPAGTYAASVNASDGVAVALRPFTITVTAVNRAPVLAQPANMTVNEGATADQGLSAIDADGQALTFSLASGPVYATVTTTAPGTGTATGSLHLAPGFAAAGTASATVSVTDGGASDSKSLTITVNNVDRPPVLDAIANMTVAAGATADQGVSATDADGDVITFTSSGPAFMTLTSNAQVANTETGNIHLAPPLGTVGTFAASVTATANSATASQSYTITVSATNTAPVLAQPSNMTVNEGSTANQTLTATDVDGNELSFSLVSGPSYASVTTTDGGAGTATGNVHLAPGFSDAGTASATVRASDGSLNSDRSFLITVNNTNRAPVLDPIANMAVLEGNTAEQLLHAVDQDGDALQFQKLTGPAFMTVSLSTGVIHLAPTTGDAGTYTASASVTDGTASDSHSFSITVTAPAVNHAPVLAQLSNMTVDEASTAEQALSATDSDGDALTFSLVSGPTYATVTTTDGGSGTATGNVRLAPGFSDAGTASATVRASDGTLQNDKSFTITVNNINRAPELSSVADMTVTQGATADQAITGTDPDGDALTFSKVMGPTFMTVTTTNATTGNIHLAAGASEPVGTSAASVSASDGGSTTLRPFTITVIAPTVNHAPVLAQPANMTVNEGATADQTITATDQDGDPVAFTKLNGPAYLTISNVTPGTGAGTGNIHLAPGFSDAGTASAAIRANDGSLFSNVQPFTIAVSNVNQAPVLEALDDMTVTEGSTADQTAQATDADGDVLQFLKAGGPGFMSVFSATGVIHLEPTTGDAGTYDASVSVTDGTASDSQSFLITVNALVVNHAPVLAQPANMTVDEGSTADQGLAATDADGNALTFSLVSGPAYAGVTTTSGGSGTATGNVHLEPGFADAGTASATVRASDATLHDDKSFLITVNNVDRPPQLNEIVDMSLAAGTTADQVVNASDQDGDAITLTSSGPAFMTLSSNAQVGNNLSGNIHLAPTLGTSGTFAASVTATANGAFRTRNFTITVTAINLSPVLAQPSSMTLHENATLDQALSATDADGNALSFAKVTGPAFMVVTTTSAGAGTATGNVRLSPGYSDAGTYHATVSASDGSLSDPKSFLITVIDVNRPPVVDAGGPYTGVVGAAVSFTGTATDPDGNSLTYSWDFDASNGITSEGTGASVSHTYTATGTYTVTLTVTDNGTPALSGTDTATATITMSAFEAIVFVRGNDRFIRLSAGRTWCVELKAKNGSFRIGDVLGSSSLASYNDVSIHSLSKKAVNDDGENGEHGDSRLKVCFGKDDLRTLFASLPNGSTPVNVVITGNLRGGGSFRGTVNVLVIKGGQVAGGDGGGDQQGQHVAALPHASPNPFNPSTTIHFELSRPGGVRLHIYDVSGRLVKALTDEVMGSGPHAVAWDGSGRSGSRVSSGVYFYVLQTPDRVFKSQLVVAK